ncbi:Ribosome-associated heat shock protein implicated in the recycling of the 50S subunit [Clostridiaceae bacterium JG1575]|nr:Ribosome-associated heat shock protein implicated in the recycling of the 50S subunit [Clostridiaceae bacterium JG1575]
MRLDKFLKVSRLIKRRPVAKEACDAGRVFINGKTAKAGSLVAVDDILEITYASKTVKARVLRIQETVRKDEAAELYELLAGEAIE